MANPTNPTKNLSEPTLSKLKRIIVIIIVVIVIIVIVSILVVVVGGGLMLLVPGKPDYYIDDGSIHNYNLSNANHLNATYNFILSAYNPNKILSIYYDKVDIDALYEDETISRGTIESFYQPTRNTKRFNLDLSSNDVALSDHTAQDLKVERSSGLVKLGLKLNTRIMFKVGDLKSGHLHMKVSCAPIMTHFSSSSKGFQRTMCDVDFDIWDWFVFFKHESLKFEVL